MLLMLVAYFGVLMLTAPAAYDEVMKMVKGNNTPPPPGGAYDKTTFRVYWTDGRAHDSRVDVTAEHWIYIPPKPNKPSAERALAELKKNNVNDGVIVQESGQWNFAISLGAFRSKEAADARLADVKAHGIKTATYRQREQTVSQTMIVLREPTQATVSKLEELKSQIAGSTVNTGACPEAKG